MIGTILWDAVTTGIVTAIYAAAGAAVPIVILLLGAHVGYAVYKKLIGEWEDEKARGVDKAIDYENSGASDEAREFWANHPDAIDPDDDDGD